MTKLSQFNNDEFRPNTFVVDPAGCGCTDCLLGYSTPANELDETAMITAIALGFKLIDRRNAHEKQEVAAVLALHFPIEPVWVQLLLSKKS